VLLYLWGEFDFLSFFDSVPLRISLIGLTVTVRRIIPRTRRSLRVKFSGSIADVSEQWFHDALAMLTWYLAEPKTLQPRGKVMISSPFSHRAVTVRENGIFVEDERKYSNLTNSTTKTY